MALRLKHVCRMHSIADVANYAYRLMELSRSGRRVPVVNVEG